MLVLLMAGNGILQWWSYLYKHNVRIKFRENPLLGSKAVAGEQAYKDTMTR